MSFEKFIAADIARNEQGTIRFENGDLVVAPSDKHHIQHIIISSPGNYRFYPLLGVNASAYLNATGQEEVLKRSIREQLKSDGYQVNNIEVGVNFNIDAKRVK